MEMQEMMERLLAEIRADRKADREELQDMMKAYREDIKSDQAKIIAAFKEKTNAWIANIKDARKKTTACQKLTRANPEKNEPNSVEEEIVVEQHDILNEEVAVHSLRTCRSETAASQEDTETKPDSGKMQSVQELQEIPKEDATLMPVGGLRKRRRDQNLVAGRRQKPKRRIQASCESRRRLTVAGKKMTRHATVAWCERNAFRRIGTQGICGPRSKLTAAGIRTTRHARVAWRRENYVRKDWTMDKVEREARRAQMLRRRLRSCQENDKRISDQCGGQPPYLRKEKTTMNGIGGWSAGQRSHLGCEGTLNKKLYEIFRGRIAKQIVGTTSGLRKIRKWTLWRGRPPPKWKKR
jgi:hypothetical protein